MPIPGTVPIGTVIAPPLLHAATQLARGLYQLMSLSQARTAGGRVLVAHQLIAEYLSSAEGGSFNPEVTERLTITLEECNVVDVTTHEPGGEAETQYYYEFLVEPNLNTA